jgi:lysophospholipid acyltransferase (LPLAT)-like uncharacterized protein
VAHPLVDRLSLAVVPRIGYAYIRFLHATMRLEFRGRESLDEARRDEGQFILAFWHSRFVMMPYAYPGDRITVLSSRHRDSELLARILLRFGLDLSKGSSTRGGALGLMEILHKVKRGYDVGLTPDGPKGPRRRVKPGVIAAARLSGLPIVPVTFSSTGAQRLRSWDRTLVPRPFSRGVFQYGRPIRVPRDADADESERGRLGLESDLDRLTDALDVELGIGTEDARPPAEAS